MLKIAVCDDDVSTTGKLDMLLQKIAEQNRIKIEIEVFWDGSQLEKAVRYDKDFDIIYLDIEMKEKNGIAVAREIRKFDKNVLIVYVTSHENYMRDSFEVRPFRFIMKPVSEYEFEKCFRAANNDISNGDYYFRYSYQRNNEKILINDILYFESLKRKVRIVTKTETIEIYKKLSKVEEILQKSKSSFLRVHQSFLVNYKHIEVQSHNYIMINGEKRIPISEDRRKIIGERYCLMEDTFYAGE